LSDPITPSISVPDLSQMGVDRSRPLVIVDVDEVLGLFMQGFGAYLATHGLEFRIDKFALFQNIYRPGEEVHLDLDEGRRLFDLFFRDAVDEMPLAVGGPEALKSLSRHAEVVILTNAPEQGRTGRARWLVRHGMDYPLILNTGPKGPLASALVKQVGGKAAFVDDLVPNLDSVAEHAPHVARFQSVADPRLRPLAPSRPDIHRRIDDWSELAPAILASIT
jgi:hypothetical protein